MTAARRSPTATDAETLAVLATAIDDFASAESVEAAQRLVHRAARRLTQADGATLSLRVGGECPAASARRTYAGCWSVIR